MSTTTATTKVTIPGVSGDFTYDVDLFASAMKRTVAELWELYKGEFGYDPRTEIPRAHERAAYRKLRKPELAAIIAQRWTKVQVAQRAEEAAAEPTVETATPVEIDERIARIEAQAAQVRNALSRIRQRAAEYATADDYRKHLLRETVEQDRRTRPQLDRKLAELEVLIAPLHAEFVRRSGWTRWYLVKHLHRDVSGSRCNRRPTSDHYWLTEYSGKPEAEMIELAKSRVCTVCFPDAPVTDEPPSDPRFMTLAEAHTEALKEAKVREKASKEATWMRLPDGELLFAVRYAQGEFENDGQLKTERAANSRALQELTNLAIYFGPDHFEAPGWVETIRRCVLALAHASGQNVELVYSEMVTKIAKKASRESGRLYAGWDYPLRKALSL